MRRMQALVRVGAEGRAVGREGGKKERMPCGRLDDDDGVITMVGEMRCVIVKLLSCVDLSDLVVQKRWPWDSRTVSRPSWEGM